MRQAGCGAGSGGGVAPRWLAAAALLAALAGPAAAPARGRFAGRVVSPAFYRVRIRVEGAAEVESLTRTP